MTKSKNTKRALRASTMSLLLCIAMLIGTTFAWFTDSVSSGVNKIVAGNLDIELNYWDDDSGSWENAENQELFNYGKWEPGYMEVQGLQVKNAGNLALKWKATISSTKELSALADVIDVYVKAGTNYSYTKPANREAVTSSWTKAGTLKEFVNGIETTTYGSLKAEETADLGLALVMRTEAGNEYQGLDLGGDIRLNIVATQDTVESDSFDDQYDKDASYPKVVDSKVKMQDAINDIPAGGSGTVVLGNDIVLDEQVKISEGKNVALELNNQYKTSNTTGIWDNNVAKAWSHFSVQGGNLTVNGDGSVLAMANDCYAIDIRNGGNCTINGGTFAGNMHAVYVYKGSLTINGGTFYIQQLYTSPNDPYGWTINAFDRNYDDGAAKITIKGGTFKNFNPANNSAEGANTNFVPAGYHVTSEVRGGATWYTVDKD